VFRLLACGRHGSIRANLTASAGPREIKRLVP
jgi:hypothetical protein